MALSSRKRLEPSLSNLSSHTYESLDLSDYSTTMRPEQSPPIGVHPSLQTVRVAWLRDRCRDVLLQLNVFPYKLNVGAPEGTRHRATTVYHNDGANRIAPFLPRIQDARFEIRVPDQIAALGKRGQGRQTCPYKHRNA